MAISQRLLIAQFVSALRRWISLLSHARVKILPFFKKDQPTLKESVPGDTVLFFTEEGSECFSTNHSINSCDNKNCYFRNIRHITDILKSANDKVDIAMYYFSNSELAVALKDVMKKKVQVRIIVDWGIIEAHGEESEALRFLKKHGALVRQKEFQIHTEGIKPKAMSHKFAVVDGKHLITGSMKWSDQAIYNWVDAVVTSESSIVNAFDYEFNRLWEELDHSRETIQLHVQPFPSVSDDWKRDTFHRVFMFGENTAHCRAHMSPLTAEAQRVSHRKFCAFTAFRDICRLIETADKSVSVCFPSLTSTRVAMSLVSLFKKHVDVRVIFEDTGTLRFSEILFLIEKGLAVRSKHQYGAFEHMFIILDERLVIFGSLGWSTWSLCGNCENAVCTTQEEVVGRYNEHFQELWDKCEPMMPLPFPQ